ncbi:CoA-binding protein [Mesorhizobium sp. C264A]|uniref:CoA-binding protein n=1 Tax=Mesorhizobium sp. C264A TaxID=2956825 RepID=UPI000A00D303
MDALNKETAVSRILEPHSVAVIGASAGPSKRGYQIINALQKAGYSYSILPVNPKGGAIRDLPGSCPIRWCSSGVAKPLTSAPLVAL